MYTISKYLDEARRLANSLVIKHHDIGIIINQGLLRQHGITSSNDYTTWKYYLNLSGARHSTNNKVYFTPIESKTLTLLSISNLASYPKTLASVASRSNYYDLLIAEYPDDILYINGCINPVPIDVAINATDGDVVGLFSKYIEPQEYSLIRELSSEIRLFFTRWYIRDYNITDELYMASVLAVLYSALPNIIVNIRTKDAWTIEAHSFHIEHFFRSHLDLWDNIKVLNPSTIGWLRKNLLGLMNNVGSNDTFNTLVSKVFTTNNVGLARYTVAPSLITPKSISNQPESTYAIGDVSIIIEKLNTSYTRNNMTIPLVDVIKKELRHSSMSMSNDINIINNLTQQENLSLGKSSGVTQYTKVIDFGELNLFKIYTNNLIETIIDNWLYLSDGISYTYSQPYTDPVTRVTYNLNARTAVILFYRLFIYKLNGTDPSITSIKYRYGISNQVTRETLNTGLLDSSGINEAVDIIINNLPVVNNHMITVADFTTHIEDQILLYKKMWVFDSNVNNSFLSANIKKMINSIYSDGAITLTNTPLPLSVILANLGVDVQLTHGYDVDLALTTLFKTFTGYDLSPDSAIKDLYLNFEIILEKLGSYSIQTIPPVINNSELSVPYTTMAAINSGNGYIEVTSGSVFKALEDSPNGVIGVGNDFSNNFIPTGFTPPAIRMLSSDNSLNISISPDYVKNIIAESSPKAYAEILYSNYVLYGPDTTVEANGLDSRAVIPVDGGINALATGNTSSHNTLISTATNYRYDLVIDKQPSMHAEIYHSDYALYIPNIIAESPSPNSNIPVSVSLGNIANLTAVISDNNIMVTSSNTMITPKPVANAEVLGRPHIA